MRKFASWAKRGLFVVSPLALLAAMAASAAGPSNPDVPASAKASPFRMASSSD